MKIDESCVLMRVIMAIEVIACDVSPVAMFCFKMKIFRCFDGCVGRTATDSKIIRDVLRRGDTYFRLEFSKIS